MFVYYSRKSYTVLFHQETMCVCLLFALSLSLSFSLSHSLSLSLSPSLAPLSLSLFVSLSLSLCLSLFVMCLSHRLGEAKSRAGPAQNCFFAKKIEQSTGGGRVLHRNEDPPGQDPHASIDRRLRRRVRTDCQDMRTMENGLPFAIPAPGTSGVFCFDGILTGHISLSW